MSEDKSPVDRLLDLMVFAPAGLAITVGEEFPKLVDKGRHRVEGQVHTARLVGQFAVQLGRRQVEQWTSRPGAGPAHAEPPVSEEPDSSTPPSRPMAVADVAEGVGGAPADAGGLAAKAVAGGPGAGTGVVTAANGRMAPSTHLAIPGYDSLSASQVVQRLDGLSPTELEEVRDHELASRRRRTILSRVDQLLAGAPPAPA